jgi:hypothetical protein
MKESIAYPHDSTATLKHQVCSEKTCITCFENRGCMYEQYLFAATHNIEVFQLAKHDKERNPVTSKYGSD